MNNKLTTYVRTFERIKPGYLLIIKMGRLRAINALGIKENTFNTFTNPVGKVYNMNKYK